MIDYNSLSKSFFISIVSALCAYLVIFSLSNYVPLFFAYDFDIPAFLDITGIHFSNEASSNQWSRDALVTILLSKPISAFIAGIGFLIILMIGTRKPVSIILFLFWLNIFAFNTAFGILIDDAVAHSGTYEVAVAMNIDYIFLVAMTIILAFIIYKVGMMNGRLIIMSFPHQKLMLTRSRIIFFTIIFLVPWLIVVGYTYISGGASVPVSELLKNLPVLILLVPFLTASKPENTDFKYLPTIRHNMVDLILSLLFVTLTIIMIIVLMNGVVITG